MKQIVMIHGGSVFPDNDVFCKALETWTYDPFQERKKRRDRLKEALKSEYQFIRPEMPNKDIASYKARKIWFEKIFPYLDDEEVIVIGHSLGGMFLIKYLSENTFPRPIKQLHLISSCIDERDMPEHESYMGDFLFDLGGIAKLQERTDQIFIYHSIDDPVVPYAHAERLMTYLPSATLISFTDKSHLNHAEFPELLEKITIGK